MFPVAGTSSEIDNNTGNTIGKSHYAFKSGKKLLKVLLWGFEPQSRA
jgi:hypothetical protein